MTDNFENRAIRMLLQPSIHLYNILRYYSAENTNKILYCLANEQITELVSFLNELIENNNEELNETHGVTLDQEEQIELISLQLHLRLFISELRESYAIIRDLLYHKNDSNVINILRIVNDVLVKHNVQDNREIAEEIYYKMMEVPKAKKNKKNNDDDIDKILLLQDFKDRGK